MNSEVIIVGIITSIFNVPLILWLLNRATKKRDDLDTLITNRLTMIEKDFTIVQVKQTYIEREILQMQNLSEVLNAMVRKLDKLQLDVDRAWEAIRELKQK